MTNIVSVFAEKCNDYRPNSVQNAVDSLISHMGGVESLVPKNAKVFVKVNLVREMSPEKCGTTHPEVVVALCKKLLTVTPFVTVGDSCAGLYNKATLSSVYSKCAMTEVEQRTSATLNREFGTGVADVDGVVLKQCEFTSAFLDADVVVNVTKLKTHSFTGYTGAVKNLFGLIPGLVKVEMHSRFPELPDFCNLLVDICEFARPKIVLNVIDAVWGMDGNGPTNGNPKFIGQILASANPYALDAVAVSLFGDPLDMPVLQTAVRRGLLCEDLSDVSFDFEQWKQSRLKDFSVPATDKLDFFGDQPAWINRLAKKYMVKRVYPDKTCRGCGKCATHCPAKAITVVKGRAKVDQKKCIHCYCCQELCPFNAVRFRTSPIYKIARRLSGKRDKKKTPSA